MRSFLVRIFLYLDWIWRFTEYIFVLSPNTGKYGPEKSPYNTRYEIKISLTLNFLHDFPIFIVPSAILLVFQISVKTCHFTHHELWLRLSVSSSCWVNLHVVWDTYTPCMKFGIPILLETAWIIHCIYASMYLLISLDLCI